MRILQLEDWPEKAYAVQRAVPDAEFFLVRDWRSYQRVVQGKFRWDLLLIDICVPLSEHSKGPEDLGMESLFEARRMGYDGPVIFLHDDSTRPEWMDEGCEVFSNSDEFADAIDAIERCRSPLAACAS